MPFVSYIQRNRLMVVSFNFFAVQMKNCEFNKNRLQIFIPLALHGHVFLYSGIKTVNKSD